MSRNTCLFIFRKNTILLSIFTLPTRTMLSTRQLAAIMFTDMVGFTALMQENEKLAIQKRDRSKKIFEDSLAKHNGKLLQYYGDGTLSMFNSGLDAVRAA